MDSSIPPIFTTTATRIAGYSIVQEFGVVRGITVRSLSAVQGFEAGFQSMAGGEITLYTQMLERMP